MATESEVPTGDVSIEWTPQGGGASYVEVDNLLSAPDDTTYISVESFGAKDRYDVGNPALGGTGVCTEIRVGLRGIKGAAGNITVRIFDGAVQIGGDKTVTLPNEPAWGGVWTASWTGLSKSIADLTDCRVEVEDPNNSSPQYISGIEVEFTYTLPLPVTQINIGDVWKDVTEVKINVGDTWKDVGEGQINIGDVWKDPTT